MAIEELAGRLVLVMPFLEGESLRARLRRERQLPLPDAVAITRQVADALQSAHEHDVLHKDVKPENIYLSGSRALLMDLNLSRAITRSMEETHTGTGLTLGTPAYMSPEHASGGVEMDARAGLYSLGCVFYEMLAGEPPFTGTTPQAIWMRTLTDMPVLPEKWGQVHFRHKAGITLPDPDRRADAALDGSQAEGRPRSQEQ